MNTVHDTRNELNNVKIAAGQDWVTKHNTDRDNFKVLGVGLTPPDSTLMTQAHNLLIKSYGQRLLTGKETTLRYTHQQCKDMAGFLEGALLPSSTSTPINGVFVAGFPRDYWRELPLNKLFIHSPKVEWGLQGDTLTLRPEGVSAKQIQELVSCIKPHAFTLDIPRSVIAKLAERLVSCPPIESNRKLPWAAHPHVLLGNILGWARSHTQKGKITSALRGAVSIERRGFKTVTISAKQFTLLQEAIAQTQCAPAEAALTYITEVKRTFNALDFALRERRSVLLNLHSVFESFKRHDAQKVKREDVAQKIQKDMAALKEKINTRPSGTAEEILSFAKHITDEFLGLLRLAEISPDSVFPRSLPMVEMWDSRPDLDGMSTAQFAFETIQKKLQADNYAAVDLLTLSCQIGSSNTTKIASHRAVNELNYCSWPFVQMKVSFTDRWWLDIDVHHQRSLPAEREAAILLLRACGAIENKIKY